LSLCGITSSNPFPSVPGLYTAVAGSSVYRMTVFNYNCRKISSMVVNVLTCSKSYSLLNPRKPSRPPGLFIIYSYRTNGFRVTVRISSETTRGIVLISCTPWLLNVTMCMRYIACISNLGLGPLAMLLARHRRRALLPSADDLHTIIVITLYRGHDIIYLRNR
jgi:hypothetical protein